MMRKKKKKRFPGSRLPWSQLRWWWVQTDLQIMKATPQDTVHFILSFKGMSLFMKWSLCFKRKEGKKGSVELLWGFIFTSTQSGTRAVGRKVKLSLVSLKGIHLVKAQSPPIRMIQPKWPLFLPPTLTLSLGHSQQLPKKDVPGAGTQHGKIQVYS